MEFCPKCEALLKKKNNELICSTKDCGYTKKIGKTVKEKPGEFDPDFLVMGESDMRKDQGLKEKLQRAARAANTYADEEGDALGSKQHKDEAIAVLSG